MKLSISSSSTKNTGPVLLRHNLLMRSRGHREVMVAALSSIQRRALGR